MDGDLDSVRAVRRIVVARCRLLGLHDELPTKQFPPRTVVLTEDDRAALGF